MAPKNKSRDILPTLEKSIMSWFRRKPTQGTSAPKKVIPAVSKKPSTEFIRWQSERSQEITNYERTKISALLERPIPSTMPAHRREALLDDLVLFDRKFQHISWEKEIRQKFGLIIRYHLDDWKKGSTRT